MLFEDMNLSFWRGAKIGILGLNGSGKSSLFKILAGVDGYAHVDRQDSARWLTQGRDFDGTLWREDTMKVGYLAQEPELDPTKTVGAVVHFAFVPGA